MTTKLEILRPAEARKITGLGKTQFAEKQNPKSKYFDPTFPVAVALGCRSVGYYRHELEQWLASRLRITAEERRRRATARGAAA
ncbi:helix-turn-helix transcriptional regulator [Methylocaldum szegediense]|uniref:Prophage regulatory protein n=1 Tax=Methylocaldum szegediense TaxID=73780 RepID=A0ABN8X758_9GAMM|nr:prophage regulatory protein [Methylocaldum szegediense]